MATNNFDPTKYGATKFNPIQYGATPVVEQPQETPKKEGLLSKMFRGVTEPVVTMLARPVQLAKYVGNKIGDPNRVGGEYDLSVNLPYYGKIEAPTTGKDIVKDVGRGLETISLGIGGGGLNAIKTGAKTGLLGLAKQGAIQGAKTGAIFGTGAGLEETGTAKGAIEGGVLGAAGGAVLGFSSPFAVKSLSGVTKGLLKGTKGLGEKITGLTMTPTKVEKGIKLDYQASQPTLFERVKGLLTGKQLEVPIKPISSANTSVRLIKPGTEWMQGVDAKKVSKKLWNNTIAPALDSVKDKVSMKTFFEELKTEIVEKTPELSRRNELLKSLESLYNQYKNVANFSYKKLQDYKSGWAEPLPEKYYAGDYTSSPKNTIRGLASDKARKMIYDKVGPVIKTAYMDWGNMQNMIKEALETTPKIDTSNITRFVWQNILDKLITPITTVAGKVLYKTAEGLEFVGDKGAKKVGDIIGSDFFKVK